MVLQHLYVEETTEKEKTRSFQVDSTFSDIRKDTSVIRRDISGYRDMLQTVAELPAQYEYNLHIVGEIPQNERVALEVIIDMKNKLNAFRENQIKSLEQI